jgi:hypothetical protein
VTGFVPGGGERISATRAFAQVSTTIAILPVALREAMVAELTAFQPRLDARMKAGVPRRKGPPPSIYERRWRPAGGLVSLLSTKVDAADLRLSAGLLTRDAAQRGFYGFILDAGRGQRAQRSRASVRALPPAASLVTGFSGTRNRYSVRYTRAISPIAPGRYDITFGKVRYWARGEIGPVLLRVYDRGLRAAAWSNLTGGG